MKIFLGADHAGYDLKNIIFEHLTHQGFDVTDLGAKTLDADDDFPQYAFSVVTKVLGEEDADQSRGILVCGSGQGMAIAANRVRGIRAAVIWSVEGAMETRRDNDSNVLALASRMTDTETALDIVDAWLATEFNKKDPKYLRRDDEIEELYG
jgi:ribose 5-phosphate isomerase B